MPQSGGRARIGSSGVRVNSSAVKSLREVFDCTAAWQHNHKTVLDDQAEEIDPPHSRGSPSTLRWLLVPGDSQTRGFRHGAHHPIRARTQSAFLWNLPGMPCSNPSNMRATFAGLKAAAATDLIRRRASKSVIYKLAAFSAWTKWALRCELGACRAIHRAGLLSQAYTVNSKSASAPHRYDFNRA